MDNTGVRPCFFFFLLFCLQRHIFSCSAQESKKHQDEREKDERVYCSSNKRGEQTDSREDSLELINEANANSDFLFRLQGASGTHTTQSRFDHAFVLRQAKLPKTNRFISIVPPSMSNRAAHCNCKPSHGSPCLLSPSPSPVSVAPRKILGLCDSDRPGRYLHAVWGFRF